MKTNKFKKLIEDSGYHVEDTKHSNCYLIHYKNHKEYYNNLMAYVDKEDNYFGINSICPRDIADIIIDYAYTPFEEREEEKKYRLRAILKNGNFENLYVSKNGDNTYLSTYRKSEFTQKEIDAMPQSWKDFFIKEEVE